MQLEDDAYSAYFNATGFTERQRLRAVFRGLHAARPASMIERLEREKGLR